jgi:DNA-binding beta-propeller fold protein YncE
MTKRRATMIADASMVRRSLRAFGWWPAVITLLIWAAAVGWPMLALMPAVVRSIGGGDRADPQPSMHPLGELLTISVAWAAVVALCSAVVGWLPGRLLGSLLTRRGFVPVAALMLVPLCLPSYLVFYAWWQSWPAGTALHRWVIERDGMQLARSATLLLGLVCWSWPIVALCVGGAAARRPRARDDMLAIDGAPLGVRVVDRLRTDAPGVVAGMLIVFLATLNNTTCFDLAEVFTFANELRARAAVTPDLAQNPAQVLAASAPMVALVLAGCLIAWWMLGRNGGHAVAKVSTPLRRGRTMVAMIWLATVALPLALLWNGVWRFEGVGRAVGEFARLYSGNTLSTLVLGTISGALAAIATFGLAMMWLSERRIVRDTASVVALTWLVWSVLPGTILGMGLHAAWNRGDVANVIFRSPVILILAHLSAWGFIAPLLARWSVRSEPAAMRDVRRVDGARGLRGIWLSARPALFSASLASGAVVLVLAAGEIAVTAQVMPPMRIDRTPLAMSLLNDMHYQRPQTVLVASLLLLTMAIAAAVIVSLVWRTMLWRRIGVGADAAATIVITVSCFAGCSGGSDADPRPLNTEYAFGSPGQALGQFGYPRCIDVDPERHHVYVIDKTARVQRFDLDGHAQIEWHMPEMQQGKPTGITVAPNGHVFVLDTHYFRVIEYDADGREIRRFGSYGEGPGEFIYVTDLAIGPDGNLYISEYGGNDRVQVFSPEGQYLFEFGAFGREVGQFSRPQGLAFSRDGTELFITDACNHRVVVTDAEGHWLRWFGVAGREPGQLAYPYGLEMLFDGTIVVAEFGNNRIQHFDRSGKSLGVYGSVGRGDGELQYPWAVAAADDRIFVLDSGNNRVQVIDRF